MIAFSIEPFQVVEDNFHLIKEHWDEVMTYGEFEPIEPLWEIYRMLEKAGNLISFVARKDGGVIGYAVFHLQPNMHSRNIKTASNDVVFLKKECRKGGVGKSFLEYCDEQLEKLGVNMIIWFVKPKPDFSGVLKAMGYHHQTSSYARYIGS
jgi:GNAT superfamily N-acetyltransferase